MANAYPENASITASVPQFSNPPLNQLLNQITSIKLDRGNFLLWKNLALPILNSYKLHGHLTGEEKCPSQFSAPSAPASTPSVVTTEEPSASDVASSSTTTPTPTVINPQYEKWVAVDQLLLGWLYNSMTAEVATQVMGHETAAGLWARVQNLFGIQSQAEEDYLRQVFQSTRKNSLKMADYLRVMKLNADNLGQAIGSPVSARSLNSQTLLGLDEEYNPIVATLQGRLSISWSELQSELLVFEKRLDFQHSLKTNVNFSTAASVHMAHSRGPQLFGGQRQQQPFMFNRGPSPQYFGQRGGNSNRFRGRGRWNGYNNNNRQVCQVCGKPGHSAVACFHRFDKQFVGNLPFNRNVNFGQNLPQGGNNTAASTSSGPNAFVTFPNVSSPGNHTHFVAHPETVADPNWYVDSGASNHVTSDYNNVTNPLPYGGHTIGQSSVDRNP